MFFTDDSDRARAAAGLAADGARRPAAALSPADRALWEGLTGGRDVWISARAPAWAEAFYSRVVVVDQARGSQFDTLRDLLGRGLELPGPVACLAVAGDGFHGHRGRSWAAAPGNLHLCVALRPGVAAAGLAPALTMLPAVAVVDAVASASGGALAPGIKWVNDILLAGRKVAGVLTATAIEGDRLEHVVFGIGLNVAVAPAVAPTPFVPAVGCLREVRGGDHLELAGMARAVLEALADRCRTVLAGGPASLFAAYRSASLVLGRKVCIWAEGLDETADPRRWPPPLAAGRVDEIGPDLTLRLTERVEPVTTGRLAFAEACPFLA
ncbi:MAG: hypothetical protein AB1726_00910 [Planctomycetota bacterium]